MNTPGLAVAATLALSASAVFATDLDNRAHSKSSVVALPWSNAPAEADSFAGVVANDAARTWAAPVATAAPPGMAPSDTFAPAPARRSAVEDAPPAGTQMTVMEANALNGLAPVPEPSISTLLLSGLCAIGLLGLRRGLH